MTLNCNLAPPQRELPPARKFRKMAALHLVVGSTTTAESQTADYELPVASARFSCDFRICSAHCDVGCDQLA